MGKDNKSLQENKIPGQHGKDWVTEMTILKIQIQQNYSEENYFDFSNKNSMPSQNNQVCRQNKDIVRQVR